MAILINFGYQFALNENIVPDGSMLLASSITIHQLERRNLSQQAHFENLYFDPQLYLAGLDPNQSPSACAKLASYPWFGVTGLAEYDSNVQKQKGWMENALSKISEVWPRGPIDPKAEPGLVNEAVATCIEFQLKIGAKAIILPSPLTHDTSSDYTDELLWLDAGLNYIKTKDEFNLPVFATIALSDVCLRYSDPTANSFIEMILDTVGARKIDGVYFVVEQSSESNETRYISNTRVLWSALHIVNILKYDLGLSVGVNFFGPFGLVLEAAGADFWAIHWYKSLIRLRLADQIGGGRAYPNYWSYKAATEIHLDQDFDRLREAKLIFQLFEETAAAASLLEVIHGDIPIRQVPAWEYRSSNVTSAREHFLQSAINSERLHSTYTGNDRIDYVQHNWLELAVNHCNDIQRILGATGKTKTEHVQAWLDALRFFRSAQNF